MQTEAKSTGTVTVVPYGAGLHPMVSGPVLSTIETACYPKNDLFIFILCVWMFHVHTSFIQCLWRPERVLNPLELELTDIV